MIISFWATFLYLHSHYALFIADALEIFWWWRYLQKINSRFQVPQLKYEMISSVLSVLKSSSL